MIDRIADHLARFLCRVFGHATQPGLTHCVHCGKEL